MLVIKIDPSLALIVLTNTICACVMPAVVGSVFWLCLWLGCAKSAISLCQAISSQKVCLNTAQSLLQPASTKMLTVSGTAGLMARSVEDVEFLDRTLNNCSRPRKDVQLEGLRVGYPREWWHDTGDEVRNQSISNRCFVIHTVVW